MGILFSEFFGQHHFHEKQGNNTRGKPENVRYLRPTIRSGKEKQ